MAQPELGTKRVCPNCGARYYDLNRDPIVCPRCGTYFSGPIKGRAAAVMPVEEDEVVEAETAEAEFVSLEEADEEASGGAEDADEDEVEIEAGADEAEPFLEEEEGEDDVADIIGGVEDEEET